MNKTIGTYLTQYFKMPSLYKEDLEAIEKVIVEELKPANYKLACAGFEFKGLNDIPITLEKAYVLVIYTHSPCMRLKFAQSWAELYGGDDVAGVDEALRRIALIVSNSERRWLWTLCKYTSWLAPLLGFGSMCIAVEFVAMNVFPVRAFYLATWILGMVLVWWAIGYRYTLHKFSRIEFHATRRTSQTVQRHRQRLLIFGLGALLGAMTAVLIAKFFNWM